MLTLQFAHVAAVAQSKCYSIAIQAHNKPKCCDDLQPFLLMKKTVFHWLNKTILSAIIVGLLVLSQTRVMDDVGLQHTDAGLSRALVTYGISRGLNGVISVVQGTEVAIEPVGVGVTFTPGQILDPINDLIERFSSVVLVAGTAFGIQRVFLELTASGAFSMMLLLAALSALTCLWFVGTINSGLRRAIYKLAIVLVVIRFSVPLIAISSEQFYQYFLAPQFTTSSAQLIATTKQLEQIQSESDAGLDQASTQQRSFLESARELYQSATKSLDMRQHLDDFKRAAESISEHAIRLIVVFVFQTIIVPLASAWLLYRLLICIVRWRAVPV